MRIKILDEPVRQNVEQFLKILQRVKQKQIQKASFPEKIFKAWLNRESGQLFFAEVLEESLYIAKKEWKPIEFIYLYDPSTGEIQFFVREAGKEQTVFHSDDLTPISFRILRDTMKIFSEIGERLKGPSDLNTKISVLSKMIVDNEVSHEDRNILLAAWHYVDRMHAESLLSSLPVGTYLFRKDAFADMLEDQLEREFQKKIKCFTLTFSQEGRKVSDLTLVHMDGAWQIYDDDPSLEQKRFFELKDLVNSLNSVLKKPLFA